MNKNILNISTQETEKKNKIINIMKNQFDSMKIEEEKKKDISIIKEEKKDIKMEDIITDNDSFDFMQFKINTNEKYQNLFNIYKDLNDSIINSFISPSIYKNNITYKFFLSRIQNYITLNKIFIDIANTSITDLTIIKNNGYNIKDVTDDVDVYIIKYKKYLEECYENLAVYNDIENNMKEIYNKLND